MSQEEIDEGTRPKDKDSMARHGRMRMRCTGEQAPLSAGQEVTTKRLREGSSLRTRHAARCARRRGGRGISEEGGMM
jgi:hypothetical protein